MAFLPVSLASVPINLFAYEQKYSLILTEYNNNKK